MQQQEGYILLVEGVEETPLSLYQEFRKYGKILKAWRASRGTQCSYALFVAFQEKEHAINAMQQEAHCLVTPLFQYIDPNLPYDWLCALCQHPNKDHANKSEPSRCQICYLENKEGALEEIEQRLFCGGITSPYHHENDYIQTEMHPMQAEPHMDPQMQEYYHQEPYMEYEDPMAMRGYHDAGYSEYQPEYAQHMHPSPTVPSYHPEAGNEAPTSCVQPPSSNLMYYCIIVTNIPVTCSDETLNNVFSAYAEHGEYSSWVKPLQAEAYTKDLRAVTEGQVVFTRYESAMAALDGESGRKVEGNSIWCAYANELFICSVQSRDPSWEHHLNSPDSKLRAEIQSQFFMFGKVNQITFAGDTAFVEYFSLSSLLDAIWAMNNKPLSGFVVEVSIASSQTRWPCTNCFCINRRYNTTCESCHAPRKPFDAGELKEIIYSNLVKFSDKYIGDSFRGYGETIKPHIGGAAERRNKEDHTVAAQQAPETHPANLAHSTEIYQTTPREVNGFTADRKDKSGFEAKRPESGNVPWGGKANQRIWKGKGSYAKSGYKNDHNAFSNKGYRGPPHNGYGRRTEDRR